MLTFEERGQAITYAMNGATFMFIPSTQLRNMIAVGSPETTALPDVFQYVLLQNESIRMESDMIVKYCKGILDRKNTWILDHGDIKVVPPRFEIKKKGNEDDTGE